jgi:hypothetical protein
MIELASVSLDPTVSLPPERGLAISRCHPGERGYASALVVPSLSARNPKWFEVGKDFLLGHGYIENDLDVHEWAAPEFLEKAAAELLEEEWTKRSMARLPEATTLDDALTLKLG